MIRYHVVEKRDSLLLVKKSVSLTTALAIAENPFRALPAAAALLSSRLMFGINF